VVVVGVLSSADTVSVCRSVVSDASEGLVVSSGSGSSVVTSSSALEVADVVSACPPVIVSDASEGLRVLSGSGSSSSASGAAGVVSACPPLVLSGVVSTAVASSGCKVVFGLEVTASASEDVGSSQYVEATGQSRKQTVW